jgi:predicted lysophospholipase L1 biosynthesis ABC-type transport system permease subunit
VAGTAAEYAGGGRAVYLEWGRARRLLGVAGPHALLVTADRGRSPVEGLRTFCARHGLLLQANDDLRRLIDGLFRRVAAVLWAVMAVAFLVASLGTGNVLAMNAHEQARETVVLRAIGMRRYQVRRGIHLQGLLITLISLPSGTAAGIGLAYALNAAGARLLGLPGGFQVEWPFLGAAGGTAATVGLLASLIPAARSTRTPVPEVIRSA